MSRSLAISGPALLLAALLLAAPRPAPALGAAPSEEDVQAIAEGYGLTCEERIFFDGALRDIQCRRDAGPSGEPPTVTVTYAPPGSPIVEIVVSAFGLPPLPEDWRDIAIDLGTLSCDATRDEVTAAMPAVDGMDDGAERQAVGSCAVDYVRTDAGDGYVDSMVTIYLEVEPTPTPPPGPGDEVDECALLTAAEVEAVTGMAAQPGVTKETWTVNQIGCGWGTEPYEVQVAVSPSVSGRASDGLGSMGYPVEGVGDAAEWWWCDTCFDVDSSSSTNSLVVAEGMVYLHIGFDPVTDEAADASELVHEIHREWAIELARLILPRLQEVLAEGAGPSPSPDGAGDGAMGDLESYLIGYGLACVESEGGATECRMELDGEWVYEVITMRDSAGATHSVDASVRSESPSMPSDARGFLRGVAERAPVSDPAALVAWFDSTASSSGEQYADGDWSAAWEAEGRTWRLTLERRAAATGSPDPTAAGAPADPGTSADAGEGKRPFAASVPAPADVSTDPMVVLQSVALAALLVFLMPFPSQLFNSTLEAHEAEVRRWFRLERLGSAVAGLGAFWSSWPGVLAFTLLAALLYGFLDPGFGLDLGSLATFVGMLLGIVLVTAAFAVPAVLAHRRIGDRWSLKVVPVSLLIGVACVLLSRLTGFQPGYLYGLLIGLAFARELSALEEGRATALGAALMLAVAFGAWLALGVVPDGDGFAIVVGRTTLAALMVAGLEGVVFGLLPMRFLPGEPLYAWNRLLWGVLLAIGAFAFFHILINPASGYLSDTSRTPLFTVIALLLGFTLISVAFWAWFRFRGDTPTEEPAT